MRIAWEGDVVPKFIPTTLSAISPTLDLEEAINRRVGQGPHDYRLFHRLSDDSFAVEINGAVLSLTEAEPHMKDITDRYTKAAEAVLEALQVGDLKTFVMKAADATIWKIPRSYFYRKKAHQLALTTFGAWEPGSGEDSSMYGQPILLSEAQFASWLSQFPSSSIVPEIPPPSAKFEPKTERTEGVLPPQAKRGHRAHEQFAHQAAALIRETGVSPQRAFEQVAPSDPMRKPESVASAIRATFGLMYDLNGIPHKN